MLTKPITSAAGIGVGGKSHLGGWMPPLDGLRGLAILLVMLFHYGTALNRSKLPQHALSIVAELGWTGVDLFFVLSGFLITGILLDSREADNYFSSFYFRRVLRIFPLYYFSLLLVFSFTRSGCQALNSSPRRRTNASGILHTRKTGLVFWLTAGGSG
jgi:peptidoglycan/LPS O-acetylase OafA/YrhL